MGGETCGLITVSATWLVLLADDYQMGEEVASGQPGTAMRLEYVPEKNPLAKRQETVVLRRRRPSLSSNLGREMESAARV
jgi:hypothetical protein